MSCAPAREADDRGARLEALMGPAPPWAQALAAPVRRRCERAWDRHVAPFFVEHWPDTNALPKLRFLATHLYASAAWTALFCSSRRPLAAALFVALPSWAQVPLAPLALALLALTLREEARRIALVAAFVATVDHLFDHVLDDPPAARAARVRAVLLREQPPALPAERLVRALLDAIEPGPALRPRFDAVVGQCVDWAQAEARGLVGEPDPEGLGHRGPGIRGTIDGLLLPLHCYADEGLRGWMVSVSLFCQIMDDWLDEAADRTAGRLTPVTAGAWGWADVERQWRETVRGARALPGGEVVAPVYVAMMTDVMRAMASGSAA